jgi:membrane associated rhomboid family serine protease
VIPLKADVPSRSVPVVTLALIGLNVLAFLYQVSLGFDTRGPGAGVAEAFVLEFGVVPCRLTGSCPAALLRLVDDFPHPWVTVVTSMFLHGGLFHIGGNMLYLWIFGNNVEDVLGHAKYFFFYIACGVLAGLAHIFFNPDSTTPTVGASGAVAGVLGAYMVMYPGARVLTLVFLGIFIRMMEVPAAVLLFVWFVMQSLQGFLSLGVRELSGGVAWFAHVGGFVAGAVLSLVLAGRTIRETRERSRHGN